MVHIYNLQDNPAYVVHEGSYIHGENNTISDIKSKSCAL